MDKVAILAVIPSLSPRNLEQLVRLVQNLSDIGIKSLVVANGESLDQALSNTDIARLSPHRNLGFGAAVNLAANSQSDWEWLLIANDDISLNPTAFAASLAHSLGDPRVPTVVYFDEGPAKPVPHAFGVFCSLSLLDGALNAFPLKRRARNPTRTEGLSYRSFSLVAISRTAWSLNSGLDEHLLFTYEDADFVRRGLSTGAEFIVAEPSGVQHVHSATSRAHIDTVLPVSAWSAYTYLEKWGQSSLAARSTCLAALVLRSALIPFVAGSRRRHFRGNARAFIAVARGRAPMLPDYWLV